MKKKTKKILYTIDWIAVILLLAGGINWGLIGFFGYNLVIDIFSNLSKFIYSLVGVSSIYIIGRSLMNQFMKK